MGRIPAIGRKEALAIVSVLAFTALLLVAMLFFPASADRSVGAAECEQMGGTWRSGIAGHGGFCER